MLKKINQFSLSLKELSKNSQFFQDLKNAEEKIIESIKNNGKIMVCGNGGSATQASHMVGELVGRFGFDRPALPAISLFDLATTTAIGNDFGYEDIFSRFVDGLGNKNDILFSISTSGNSKNCLKAVESAKKKNMLSISLLGKDGGKMKDLSNISIVAPFDSTPMIQEVHLMVIHELCDKIEKHFFKK